MKEHTILITGGTGKIGFEYIKYFLSSGHTVIALVRSPDALRDKISNQHHSLLHTIQCDLFQEAISSDLELALKKLKLSPSILIFTARSLDSLKVQPDGSQLESDLLNEYRMGVTIPYQIVNSINKLSNNKLEHIIFISSMYGVVAPNPTLYEGSLDSSPIGYGVTKAAQIHLTKELAIRLAPKVKVNCISYGGIKGRVDAEFEKRYNELTPLNTMLNPEGVLPPLKYLISNDSFYATGQNIQYDGGWTIC